MVPCYWFAGYNYYHAPTEFSLIAHPEQGGYFVDDSKPGVMDPIAGYGTLGFNTAGSVPDCSGGGLGRGQNNANNMLPSTPGAGGGQESDDPWTFVEMGATSDSAYAATYRALKAEYGLHVLAWLAPDGLFCRMSEAQRAAVAADPRVLVATTDPIEGVAASLRPGEPGYSQRTWNLLLTPPEAEADGPPETVPDVPVPMWTTPPRDPNRQTGSYLIGDVGVSLLFMESTDDGPCDRPHDILTENWSSTGIDSVVAAVTAGLAGLADMAPWPDVGATFHIMETPHIHTTVEPDLLPISQDSVWINQAMDTLLAVNPPACSYESRVYLYDNQKRGGRSTAFDWWITDFAIRDSCNATHRFPPCWPDTTLPVSFSLDVFGPGSVLLEHNGSGTYRYVSALREISAHETCHLFGAEDEYPNTVTCTTPCGYLGVTNGNQEDPDTNHTCADQHIIPCLMVDAHRFLTGQMCPYTRAQIGWRDSTGAGAYDPIDNPRSGRSMLVGDADDPDSSGYMNPGDFVDIFHGYTWEKRLTASNSSSDRGRLLWDGIGYDGHARPVGNDYSWQKNRTGSYHNNKSLIADTQAPSLFDVRFYQPDDSLGHPGPYPDTVSFRFSDNDTHAGRVRATATSVFGGLCPEKVIDDEFFRARGESDPPVKIGYLCPRGGLWRVGLYVWDVGAGHYAAQMDTFVVGMDPAGVRPRQILIPELALSRARPNPSGSWVYWNVQQRAPGKVNLRVISVDGRCVKSWPRRDLSAGTTRILWDGRDNRGARVASGRYFLLVTDETGKTKSNSVTIVK